MLDSLEDELQARDAQIQDELQWGNDDLTTLHKQARWHMYRTFVAAVYGYLGKGCRVRLAHCVLSAIRCRYRAPTCDCSPRDIATCSLHGYVGHRES